MTVLLPSLKSMARFVISYPDDKDCFAYNMQQYPINVVLKVSVRQKKKVARF